MKSFLKKRWLGIPTVVIVPILLVCLLAGSVFAAFGFFTSALQVQVEEAIVVAIWPAWDNLEPYGSVDDVEITLAEISPTEATISITTIEGYAGAGFVAGEWIVIPVNFRNAGDGELSLSASVAGSGLALDCCWRINTGTVTETLPDGRELARNFKDDGSWAPLKDWTATIAGNGGESGSAVKGAQVLFVRITAPGDIIAPGTYTLAVTFSRS